MIEGCVVLFFSLRIQFVAHMCLILQIYQWEFLFLACMCVLSVSIIKERK